MRFYELATCQLLASVIPGALAAVITSREYAPQGSSDKIAPKAVIISMFDPEAEPWFKDEELNLDAQKIKVDGLSPLFPEISCTENGDVCQITVGEGEINAATSMTALTASPKFDLTKTYFMVAGIAGIDPKQGTLASVNFARYAVHTLLQHEIDAREIPDNFDTGYVSFGTKEPGQYPSELWGTEVFELSEALQKLAIGFAEGAELADSDKASEYRALYNSDDTANAVKGPNVQACDVATGDTYWHGEKIGTTFAGTVKTWTNGTGKYCLTQCEDNATLESLLRSAKAGLVDFSRIIVMRTASNFDRPHPGQSAADSLLTASSGGFVPACENLYRAGIKVVNGIREGWDKQFKEGVKPANYIGDIFGTLGGTPDFGPGPVSLQQQRKRNTESSLRRRGVAVY
ncbi:MAG: hypothetical protein M1833_004465 [Piccolia ochrophora]|nr:MAG: hypothetical protein M1833_004465 [Piccolia ochrophora]